MSRRYLLIAMGLVLLSRDAALAQAEGVAFFETKIRPVLVEHCYSCHSADAQKVRKLKGGLLLDSRAGIRQGGDSGPAVVAGDVKGSLLLKALRHEDDLRMPPKGLLPKEVLADFEHWVKLGAPDPRDGKVATTRREIDVEAGRRLWAFRPLQFAPPPPVRPNDWVRTGIDQFILARLEAKNLTPNSSVNRETLIRRAYFDLWGLPPSPAEIDAFVRDPAEDAYEKLIDRLLAGEAYGERWARHWLDVVRFAESGGYEFDGDRPGAHLYRDFVIKALNQDMPYDEFVRLQVAGDQLRPDDFLATTATGFLVAGPFPGQITAKTRDRIRYDHLDDMVSTLGSAFLGLSLGCVRCHEHKYDPIPQQDYYRLVACLSQTDSSRPKLDPNPVATRQAKADFDREHGPLVAILDKYRKDHMPAKVLAWAEKERTKSAPAWLLLDAALPSTGATPLKRLEDGSLLVPGKSSANDKRTFLAQTHQRGITAVRLEILADGEKAKGTPAERKFAMPTLTLSAAPIAGAGKATPVKLRPGRVVKQTDGDTVVVFESESDLGLAAGTALTAVVQFESDGPRRLRLALTSSRPAPAEGTAEPQAAREILTLLGTPAKVDDKYRALVSRWYRRMDPTLAAILDTVEWHSQFEPRPKLFDGFVAGTVGDRPVHFLVRGEVERKTGLAVPGFLQVLMTAPEKDARWAPVDKKEAAVPPRVALARWLTDPQHGAGHLLARVIVNRLWQHHLGRGLVATPNDFGAQGEAPTHPELLDHLAGVLIASGWRLQPIHKLIMTSAVYRQGGEPNEAALKVDPRNELWWRRPPRRLEAETIRDTVLAVGGSLDRTMFGPGTLDETSLRRSVYLTVKRSKLVPFLQMFDAPEAIQSIGVRSSTTVATQALAMMNSPLVRQQAEKMAQRLKRDDLAGSLAEAYRVALGRRPTDAEATRMRDFVTRQTASYGNNARAMDQAFADGCHALLCLNEFLYVD